MPETLEVHDAEIESRLFELLAELRTIVTPNLRDEVVELISLGAYAPALIGLCRILVTRGLTIPSAAWEEIVSLAWTMRVDAGEGVVGQIRPLVRRA